MREALSPLNVGLVLLGTVITIYGFLAVPPGTMLPVHWGISGAADRFLPRDLALLLLPGIALGAIALLLVIQRLAGEPRRRAARHAIAATIPMLLVLFIAIQAAMIMIGIGHQVDMVRIAVFCVGLMFVVLGNVMPKTQPNPIAGIRLPWTINSPRNWQATHRLAGLLMMAGGAVMMLAALLTRQPILLLVLTLASILVPLALTIVYSYRLAQRTRPG